MANKKNLIIITIIVIIVLAIIVLAVINILSARTSPIAQELKITTDKKEYGPEDDLKVNINNDLDKNVCFSSCYPYYIERKESDVWKSYSYSDCQVDNLVKECVDSAKVKAFTIILPSLTQGTHRLAIPVCMECNLQEAFRGDLWFYSNEFVVK